MKYLPLFVLIQLVNLPLMIAGVPICALLAATKTWRSLLGEATHWPSAFWIWDNEEDGIFGDGPRTRWRAFYWSALRNPVANLRHVPGVSRVGRPLWYWSNGRWYAKAGWMSDGFPCLSAGSGKGY